MPAPEDLLKSLTGHPTAVDNTLGCMTRIFHIFEGHPALMGRRSSSTRLGIDSGSQLRTQTDSHPSRHDRRNPTSTMEDGHKKTGQPTSQHHKSYSDISDLAATPTRTFTEFCTSKDDNGDIEAKPANSEGTKPSYSEGTKPAFSEGTLDALAFYNYESLRAAAIFAGDPRRRSDLDHREYSKRSVTSPNRVPKQRQLNSDYTQQSSSSEIRDALLATFRRESERPKLAKSDQALKRNGSKEAGSRKGVNLPRSNSIFARGLETSEILQWKDGLRSSASPPRRLTREAAPLKGSKSPSRSSGATKMLSHHSSPERRVEPKKDRGRSLSKDYPFPSRSPKKIFGPHGERTLGKDYNGFKESPGASNFRESLRPFMIGAQERHIVPARESFASRLVDSSGQDLDGRTDTSVNVIARLMGLEAEIPSSSTQQNINSSSEAARDHAKSRGDKFFRGLVQFDPQTIRSTSPPPPPPYQSKKHHLGPPSAYYKQQYNGSLQGDQYQGNYPPQFNMEQGLCCCEEDRDYEHLHLSGPFLSFEDDCKELATGQLAYNKEGLPDAHHSAPEVCSLLVKQSPRKKKMLWKILEAMRPKVLLKISRRKQTEQDKSPVVTNSVTKDIIVQPVRQVLEKQQQTTQMNGASFGSKLPSGADNEDPPRYSSSIKQVQEQQQQTDSSNSTESSIVKPCISQPDESKSIVVMKPTANTLSTSRPQLPNADIFQVRQVESASSNSYDKEKCPTRKAAQRNNEDCNLANDLRRAAKPVKSRVAVENAPRSSAHADSTLESDCETDSSSVTKQCDKPDINVRESRKIRNITRPNPRSRSPISDTHRKQGLGSSPEVARPSLTRSLPSKDKFHGTVGRKAVFANGNKDSRSTPATAKAKLPKEEILKRRVSEKPVTSRLRENESIFTEKSTSKETFPIRAAGAKARSPGVVRLKQSNEGAESRGAPLGAPPKELDVSCPSTTDPVTLDTSENLNSAVQIQPQPQPSDSEPAMEHLVAVQGPKLGGFKEPHVYIRSQLSETQSEVQPEVQMIEGDQCEDTEQPSNSGACSAIPDEPQPLLQIQEAAIGASEELTTPRGNQLKNGVKLDDKLAEAMDRTSPVSVLDTTTFDDDLTLSPTSSSKHNVVQEDSVTTDNDEEHQGCVKDVAQAYRETPAANDGLDYDELLFSKCAEGLQTQVESTETEDRLNKLQSYFKDAEPGEEKTFVGSFLSPPETDINSDKVKTKQSKFELPDTETVNENLLQSLQSNGILQENDHILLLDCLEEIMERILESQSNIMLWAGLPPETICEIPKGKQLEQELWMEVQNMKRSSSSVDDICDTVHNLLLKNLLRCQGRQWSTFNADREKIGLDMETMIVGDLIEEAVGELCVLQCHKKGSLQTETTRRQLFTN